MTEHDRNREQDEPSTQPDAPLTGHPEAASEQMRLRADPPRVTRLSRKVLAVGGFVTALAIGGALVVALQSRAPDTAGEELYSLDNRQTADGLVGLPRDYTGPVLGPPLPGDLGRPILAAQNRGQPVVPPPMTALAVDPDEQRRLAEEEAARTSQVFFETTGHAGMAASLSGGLPPLASAGSGSASSGDATAADRQRSFLEAPTDRRTVAPDRLASPASPFVLQAGAVIPAALVTGIRSDLSGLITAQVTENVYDSPTGRVLLVPKGTRLIGQYDNDVGFGQRRVLLV